MSHYSGLQNAELLQAIHETYEALAALAKYQKHLTSGAGLPTGDATRTALIAANASLTQKIKEDLDELEKEAAKRKLI